MKFLFPFNFFSNLEAAEKSATSSHIFPDKASLRDFMRNIERPVSLETSGDGAGASPCQVKRLIRESVFGMLNSRPRIY